MHSFEKPVQVADGEGRREGNVKTVSSWVSGFAEMRKSGGDAGVGRRWTSPSLAYKVGDAFDPSRWTNQVRR